MKPLSVILGIAAILSSYLGARMAVESQLKSPQNQTRIAATHQRRQQISDSIIAANRITDSLKAIKEQRYWHHMDMLCAKDWELVTKFNYFSSVNEFNYFSSEIREQQREVIAGRGTFTRAEPSIGCTLNDSGAVVARRR